MCIRITKELKEVYENVMNIDLGKKIPYSIFTDILAHLGYIDKRPNEGAKHAKAKNFIGPND